MTRGRCLLMARQSPRSDVFDVLTFPCPVLYQFLCKFKPDIKQTYEKLALVCPGLGIHFSPKPLQMCPEYPKTSVF
jgi:hypothetical protein